MSSNARPVNVFEQELLAARPHVMMFALSLTHNTSRAEDLVQDTMLRAWSARTSFTPGTNMKAWLYTIARNSYFTQLRRKKREVEDPEGVYAATLMEEARQSETIEVLQFAELFDRLPEDQRRAIELVIVHGHTYQEAADILGCAEGTIKSRIFRARLMLTALLAHQEQNEFNTVDYDLEGYKKILHALEKNEPIDFDPLER